MAKKRRQRVPGVVPAVARGLWQAIRWTFQHARPFVAVAAVLAVVGVCGGLAIRSDAFVIQDVQMTAETPLKVPPTLIGRNVWDVDLRGLSDDLKRQQPHLKQVRVTRRLPNALSIQAVQRVPVAQIKLVQWYLVDADGYVLPQARQTPFEQVVLLKGVEQAKAPLKVGRENATEAMQRALRVLSRLRTAPALAAHRLVSIDVSDPAQLLFAIDDEIEIRCGSEEELAIQLGRLRAVLDRVAKQDMIIRYVDLRFPDPVVGPRI